MLLAMYSLDHLDCEISRYNTEGYVLFLDICPFCLDLECICYLLFFLGTLVCQIGMVLMIGTTGREGNGVKQGADGVICCDEPAQ